MSNSFIHGYIDWYMYTLVYSDMYIVIHGYTSTHINNHKYTFTYDICIYIYTYILYILYIQYNTIQYNTILYTIHYTLYTIYYIGARGGYHPLQTVLQARNTVNSI